MWTAAAFSASLAWHWPDHHWQCNWRVTWTSSRVYAGKRRTRRATICDNIQPYDKKHFCFCQMWHNFRLFFWKLPQFHASNVCKVVWQHIVRVLLEIYLAFQQWKNFENPLRIDNCHEFGVQFFLAHPVYLTLDLLQSDCSDDKVKTT